MNEDAHTISSGHMSVGDGHNIYYQRWGNQKKPPIFFLHGGPGSGLKDTHKLSFNPEKHQVIFHDQRGCGKSTPFGSLSHNTTPDLIADIEKLREKCGFEKISFFGSSWGSCLALAYAVEHPDRVVKMLLSGIYTGTKRENDYIQQGGLSSHFPDSWEQYIEMVPEDKRHDTVGYYFEKMQDKDKAVADEHIRRWNINESAAAVIDPFLPGVTAENSEVDDKARSTALLEAHYFINDCFMPDQYILRSAKKLSGIPVVFVHGRHDHVCPPDTAYELSKAIGENCRLHLVPGSHARENAVREVMLAYLWALFG